MGILSLYAVCRFLLQKTPQTRPTVGVFHDLVIYSAAAYAVYIGGIKRHCNSVIDRSRRLGYCSPDTSAFDELCDTADDELFSKAVRLPNLPLHALLPPSSTASQRYNLRHRVHSLQLKNTY